MIRLELPDCRAPRDGLRLSEAQRRELVRLLAQEGSAGLDSWLRQQMRTDPYIRQRVEAEQAALEREALAERRRLQQRHSQESQDAQTAWERRMQEAQARERELAERLAQAAGPLRLSAHDLASRSALFRAAVEGPGPGLWRRFVTWLRRVWLLLVSAWVRLVRKATGRGAVPVRSTFVLPDGVELDLLRLGPDALVLHGEASASRLRRAWDRLLGRSDYATEAARLMEQERQRVEAQKRAEEDARAQALRRELSEQQREGREDGRRREAEQEARRRRHEQEMARLARQAESAPLARLRDEVLSALRDAGLVDETGRATVVLVRRFAGLLYEEARRSLPGHGESVPGTYVEGEGEYELGPLRSQHEIGAMELVASLVQARLRHPRQRHVYDDDVLVHREVRMASAHVVLVFDTSGSMEEHGRLDAAKRVCLVLHQAVKDRNPDHRVDLLRMHTSVERVGLAECWNSEPMGFTNHGAALAQAHSLLRDGGADQKLLYVVTDGLPEAYTRPDGTDKADRPDVCMEHALREAKRLRDLPGLRTTILQLETRDPRFLDAAAVIARACGGRVEPIDPATLTSWMLGDLTAAQAAARRS